LERQHLRIGIDAKWFFNGPVSNRLVVRQLAEQLIAQNPGHELFFFPRPGRPSPAVSFSAPGVHLHYVWARNNQLSNLLVLPRLAGRLCLDVVVFQNFASFMGGSIKLLTSTTYFFTNTPSFTPARSGRTSRRCGRWRPGRT
jgi:hypothetical protein